MNIQSVINKLLLQNPTMKPNVCFSQNGEDLILQRIFKEKSKGFYIDIGAHHPIRFSNTHLFYKKGWNGLNIDAMPGSMKLFNRLRKRDINIEHGIALKTGYLTYYQFNDPALNTFNKKEADSKISQNYKIINSTKLKVDRLDTILKKYLPENISIDFMSIDVEGKDMEVVLTNDWDKYRPEYILIETLHRRNFINKECRISSFLRSKGYEMINKAYDTCIFTNNY